MITKITNFDNKESIQSFGVIVEGPNKGQWSYVENPEIKDIKQEDKWIKNPGYDESKIVLERSQSLKRQIISLSLKKDKASQLQFVDIFNKLTEGIQGLENELLALENL